MLFFFRRRRRKKKYESSITDPFLSVPFILFFFLHFLLFCLLLFLGWARISKHDSQRIYIDIGARMNYAKKKIKKRLVLFLKKAMLFIEWRRKTYTDLWALFYISFRLEKKKLASSWGYWGNIVDVFIYFFHLFIYLI